MDGRRIVARVMWLRLLAVVPLLAAGVALGVPTPAAAAFTCPNGHQVRNETIYESLIVPDGQFCTLRGAVVRGRVTIGANAHISVADSEIRGGATIGAGALFAVSGTELRGSVSGIGVHSVSFFQSDVRGSVAVSVTSLANVQETVVRTDVTIGGAGSYVFLASSEVGGSVTLDNNTQVAVFGTTIAGDLACSGNGVVEPAWEPNTIGGVRSGQCAGL